MDNKLNKIIKELKPHQKIEISFNGDIHITWRDNSGKKHSYKTDNLYTNIEPDFAINGASWVTVNSPALKSYRKFGDDSRERMELEFKYIVSIFEFQCEIQKIKEYNQLDNNSHTWQVKETTHYKGFYLNGKLAKLEDKTTGKQTFIHNKKPKLNSTTINPEL